MDPSLDYSKIPSVAPPAGVTPNFIDPVTNASVAKIVISILLPVTLIFVTLRTYCNFRLDRKRAYSDYVCILAMIASVSFIAVMYLTISQHIIGRHMWDVPISMNTNSSVQNFMVIAILYGPAIFLAKLTVLLLYLEVFSINTPTRIMIFVAMAIITAHFLTNTIGNAVLCVPLPGESWQLKDSSHACIVVADQLSIALGAISVLTDFFIILIPIPVIWRLQLATHKKIGVSLIFITGIFACLASILALVYRIRQYTTKDNTWNSSYTYMLCAVEINVTIMCSCMPAFAPYTRQVLHTLHSKIRSLGSTFGRYLSSGSSPKRSGSVPLNDLEYTGMESDDKMRLTLGSAVRQGKFLTVKESDSRVEIHREVWDHDSGREANKVETSVV